MVVQTRSRTSVPMGHRATGGGRGPVLLATVAVRFEPAAERVAIDGALESGLRLTVVNLVRAILSPTALILGLGPSSPDEPDRDRIRATANRASALGIPTEHLRVITTHPARALLELAGERRASLIVFGPDRGHIPDRRFTRIARRLQSSAPCLVWVSAGGDVDPAAEASGRRKAG